MSVRTSAASTMSPLTFHEQDLKAHDTGGKRSPELNLRCMSPSVGNECGKVTRPLKRCASFPLNPYDAEVPIFVEDAVPRGCGTSYRIGNSAVWLALSSLMLYT